MQNEVVQVQVGNVEPQLLEVVDVVQSSESGYTDFPVDIAYKKRVMEDLDALLADLQSTTANISSFQKNQNQSYSSQPQQQQNFSEQNQGDIYSQQSSGHLNLNSHSSSGVPDVHLYQQNHSTVNYPSVRKDQVNFGVQGYSAQVYSQPELLTVNENYDPTGGNSGSSTPPPLPPPPLDDLEYGTDFEPVYEQQTFQIRESTPSSVSSSSDRVVVQQGAPVRDRGERMSALSNNLSELDQLLQDLNSAQFLAEVDRKSSNNANEVTVANGTPLKQPPPVAPKPSTKPVQRTSVDNLLDQLEVTGSQPGRFPVDSNYQELDTVSHSHSHNGGPGTVYRATSTSSASSTSSLQQPQTASTATKELDELMMSLSEFRNKEDGAERPNEPAYAKPVKSRTASGATPTSPNEPGPIYHELTDQRQLEAESHQQEVRGQNGLEIMLGDLQSDLNRQGVNIKQKGICAACQKPIVGQVIAALGRTWHVEHFVCAHCEEPLGTRNFYERDSLAYCETDYHQLFAPRCAYCNGAIVDKCITALEKMWHPEHFFCAQCGRPFGEEDFHEKNGKAYCKEDYFQMFAPKCGGCAQPIMENYISALNRQWHPDCFVCWDCRQHFGAGSFFDYDGLPYCETHYHAKKGSLCAGCERPITGRCITAMFRKFHPEHFVCAFCLKQLNKGTFKEQNDKPYCHPCFVKLFG